MNKTQFALLAVPSTLVILFWMFNMPPHNASLDKISNPANQVALVTSVIDGDTFDIGPQRFRLWGIDAPEIKQKCYDDLSFWLCGEVAAQKLREKIMGQAVLCSQAHVDRDSRAVAKCSLGSTDLSQFMVESGWAIDWPKHSRGQYSQSESNARKAALGIFSKNAN